MWVSVRVCVCLFVCVCVCVSVCVHACVCVAHLFIDVTNDHSTTIHGKNSHLALKQGRTQARSHAPVAPRVTQHS